jgi:hypothetical protein
MPSAGRGELEAQLSSSEAAGRPALFKKGARPSPSSQPTHIIIILRKKTKKNNRHR